MMQDVAQDDQIEARGVLPADLLHRAAYEANARRITSEQTSKAGRYVDRRDARLRISDTQFFGDGALATADFEYAGGVRSPAQQQRDQRVEIEIDRTVGIGDPRLERTEQQAHQGSQLHAAAVRPALRRGSTRSTIRESRQ